MIKEEGERVAYEANVAGLHPELIRLLGRLKFRTSYGQNVLQHSLEVSIIAAGIAAEIGADINVAKTAGLLHDIGKAVDHEVEGPHALIGAEIAAAARPLVAVSSTPSRRTTVRCSRRRSRPSSSQPRTPSPAAGRARGARWWISTSSAWKRWRASRTPSPASSAPSPSRRGARSGSRSSRMSSTISTATRLARDVVKKIEETMEYPGQIKVTVIREMRVVDYAR